MFDRARDTFDTFSKIKLTGEAGTQMLRSWKIIKKKVFKTTVYDDVARS